MFSDEEIKSDSGFMRPDDELISIQEVCLVDKYDKKDFGFNTEPVLFNSGRSNLDVGRFFRDGFCESLEQQQAKFAWTEEDGNIASLFSSPAFGTGSSKELDDALSTEFKETETSTESNGWKNNGVIFKTKSTNSNAVSSTSGHSSGDRPKGKNSCKIDKEDPRSRLHFVKYIKTHGRTIKLWECGICSREFQHQYTLMRHLPTHTDERNYHCDECSKSFRQLSTLSQHRAIHSAERPYSCEVCKKTFNRVSTLISHRKTHSEEKPYRCHICPKGFHQKGNLRNHLFTHTNERPYRCNICKKGYNQQSNLVCHKNKAHPDNKETISIERISCQTLPSTSKAPKPTPKPRPECEVSSSMSPETAKQLNTSFSGLWSGGVIVDPIKTYHMSVAMATRQTPFALLQDDNGVKVLVKVVDSELLGGKQMLVPATAEDLRVGGKIVLKDQDSQDIQIESVPKGSALQIRVPVVATVVPKIAPGGALHLAVEEPHHAYHSALSTDSKGSCITSEAHASCSKNVDANETIAIKNEMESPSPSTAEIEEFQHVSSSGPVILSTYSLLPPAPSPPLDYIPLDLFESMACMPMGPQITTVNIDQPPSDESDIFITKFEDHSNTA